MRSVGTETRVRLAQQHAPESGLQEKSSELRRRAIANEFTSTVRMAARVDARQGKLAEALSCRGQQLGKRANTTEQAKHK